ncbi:adenosylcobinamide-GDP ribazoletransferase [Pelagibacterium sp. H642]|uniref:adenosylcobinamide-GDP ribazoletransferase n=1 Tax=Pelagibacterium sp. H642 TaxID=1881069 RepID=UPI002815FA83|nr:adenosylcobinamide-GDP ribazoletransferase [Pelagibacterium sp. H642]WMT91113.1 adenosylcobinamide-GDP ribazoletransferase [Pelagibacterium sp. H642]
MRASDDNPIAGFVMAIRFFSRLPTGSSPHATPNLDRIARVLPFASLAIAALPALLLFAASRAGLDPLFSAFLAAALSAIVTGAMSEDAAADAADGLFGGSTRERRLEILKDSRHGTYGVLAIVFVVGLKVAALSALAAHDALEGALVWLAAAVLARSGSIYIAFALPPARATGAAATAGQVSGNGFAIGLVLALALASALALPFVGIWGGVIAAALAVLMGWGWTRLCDRLMGGQTGDLIGALNALLEIALLGTFMHMVG